jgi:hypothetical protein
LFDKAENGHMASLVLDLQRECLDSQLSLPPLLRKALVIAKKLKISEFEDWIGNELNGYYEKPDVPPYRMAQTSVEVQDSWGRWSPMPFPNSEIEKLVATVPVLDSVAEVEEILHGARKADAGRISIPFSPEHAHALMNGQEARFRPMRFVRLQNLCGILDSVRTEILNWTLKLEGDGILGEGMTFSRDEQRKAAAVQQSVHYHIGTMTQSQIQHGSDHSSAELNVGSIAPEDVQKFVALLKENTSRFGGNAAQLSSDADALETQLKMPQPDRSLLRSILMSIKTTLEGAAGNVIASGLLYELGKLLS